MVMPYHWLKLLPHTAQGVGCMTAPWTQFLGHYERSSGSLCLLLRLPEWFLRLTHYYAVSLLEPLTLAEYTDQLWWLHTKISPDVSHNLSRWPRSPAVWSPSNLVSNSGTNGASLSGWWKSPFFFEVAWSHTSSSPVEFVSCLGANAGLSAYGRRQDAADAQTESDPEPPHLFPLIWSSDRFSSGSRLKRQPKWFLWPLVWLS